MQLTVDSLRNKIELKFEEAAEMLEDIKREVLRKYDNRWEEVFKGLEESSRELEDRIESYDLAIAEINRIRTKSKNANEELLEFVFENQAKMEELNAKGQDPKEDAYVLAFDKISNQINGRLMRSMEVKQMPVFAPLRDYFTDILGIDEPKPKLTMEKKAERPQVIAPRDSSPEEAAKSTKKQKKNLMEDIKAKLKQYEKLRKDSSEEPEPRPESREESTKYSKPAQYTSNPKLNGNKPKTLDLRNALNQRKSSQDSMATPMSSDRAYRDYTEGLEKYLDEIRPVDRSRPIKNDYRSVVHYPPAKYKYEKRSDYSHHRDQRRPVDRPERGRHGSIYDRPYHEANHSKHQARPSHQAESEADNSKHSNWYFESMKTINDLKNFRDNVRSKLNITAAPPGRPASKYTTPRYSNL